LKYVVHSSRSFVILQLVDLGAANGTKVNGRLLEQSEQVQLAAGDTVQLGASTRTYIVRMTRKTQAPVQVERYPEPAAAASRASSGGDMLPPPAPRSTQDQHLVDEAAAMAALMPDVAAQFKRQEAAQQAPAHLGSESAEASSTATFTAFKKAPGQGFKIDLDIKQAKLGSDSIAPQLQGSNSATSSSQAPVAPSSRGAGASAGSDLSSTAKMSTPLHLPPPTDPLASSTPSSKGVKGGSAGAGLAAGISLENISADAAQAAEVAAAEEAALQGMPHGFEFELKGFESKRAIMTLALDPGNARLVAGCADTNANLYDFGGMTAAGDPFRSLNPFEGHIVKRIMWNCDGTMFAVATGEKRLKVYTRDSAELCTTIRGDVYLKDITRAKGHIAEVTDVAWSPWDENWFASSALDGSVRLWDINGRQSMGELTATYVLRVRGASGQRAAVTAVAWAGVSPTAGGGTQPSAVIAGTREGTLYVWTDKSQYARPDLVITGAHEAGDITAIVPCNGEGTGAAGRWFATRSAGDGLIKLWDVRRLKKGPIWSSKHRVPSVLQGANVAWSPDGCRLLAGTGVKRGQGNGLLLLWDVATAVKLAAAAKRKALRAAKEEGGPGGEGGGDSDDDEGALAEASWQECTGSNGLLQVHTAVEGDSVITVAWGHRTNQVLVGCGDGVTRVMFHPSVSVKGVMMAAGRRPRQKFFASEFSRPVILNPDGMRPTNQPAQPRLGRVKRPAAGAAGEDDASSKSFQQHFMKQQYRVNLGAQNPQSELLAHAHAAKKGRFVEFAYGSDAKKVLADETLESALDKMPLSAVEQEALEAQADLDEIQKTGGQ